VRQTAVKQVVARQLVAKPRAAKRVVVKQPVVTLCQVAAVKHRYVGATPAAARKEAASIGCWEVAVDVIAAAVTMVAAITDVAVASDLILTKLSWITFCTAEEDAPTSAVTTRVAVTQAVAAVMLLVTSESLTLVAVANVGIMDIRQSVSVRTVTTFRVQ